MATDMEQFDERVDRYLKNQMDVNEKSAFIDELESNPELKQRAEAIAIMIKEMREIGTERDAIVYDSIRNLHKDDYYKTKRTPLFKYSAAAVIVIFIMGYSVVNIMTYNNMQSLGNDYCMVYSLSHEGVRGVDGDYPEDMIKLFENVEKGRDLKQTIAELEIIYKASRGDEYNEYINYSDNIGWYLAIAQLKKGKYKDAKKTLNTIIMDNPDEVIADKANELVDEINKHLIFR